MRTQEVQDRTADEVHGERQGAGAAFGAILAEDGVEDPVIGVLDAPVIAVETEKGLRAGLGGREAGDQERGLGRDFALARDVAVDAADLRDAGPLVEIAGESRRGADFPALDSAAALAARRRESVGLRAALGLKGGNPAA